MVMLFILVLNTKVTPSTTFSVMNYILISHVVCIKERSNNVPLCLIRTRNISRKYRDCYLLGENNGCLDIILDVWRECWIFGENIEFLHILKSICWANSWGKIHWSLWKLSLFRQYVQSASFRSSPHIWCRYSVCQFAEPIWTEWRRQGWRGSPRAAFKQ